MNSLFIVLLLVAIVGLIVGLTNPTAVKMKSRKRVSLVFGVIIFVLFMLVGTTAKTNPAQQTSVVTPAPVVATPESTTPVVSAPPVVKKHTTTTAPQPAPVQQSAPVSQPVTLLNISGNGSKSTQTFTTPSNSWQLHYTYDCSGFGYKGNFQVMVYTSDGSLSNNAFVNELGHSGSDTEYYHTGGTYYLEINSECTWTVKVEG